MKQLGIEKETKVLYIAGPMTGKKEWNKPAFDKAAKKLREQGFIVLNPSETPMGLTREQYMDIDLAMVRACDGIYMLNGWQWSPGATAERAYAVYLEKEIIYQGEKVCID